MSEAVVGLCIERFLIFFINYVVCVNVNIVVVVVAMPR